MPGEGEMKARIVLEGEKEYSGAIKEAQRNLRTLKSELKAESAELGKNANAQQKAEVRARSLQKQIAEQEKVVKACRAALDEVRAKYGDNADAVAKYEQKLNNARATLAGMRNDLESVSEELDGVGDSAERSMVETRSFAEALQSIGSAAGVVSDTIESIFGGMLNVMNTAIKTIWGDMVDLAAKSNNIVDLAGFWNTDPVKIQKYANAVGNASGNLSDLMDIVTKINGKESKTVAELTGVSAEGYEDMFEYAMAVMDAMSQMDRKQRNAAAFEIFGGKNATKAMDLLNDWGKVLSSLDEYDVEKGGVGMSAEDIELMSELYDTINKLSTTWGAFKRSFEAGALGKLTLDLVGNAQGFLDGFIDFMGAEDDEARTAALEAMEKNVTEFFTRIGEAITAAAETLDKAGSEMQGSENGIIRALGTVLRGLSDVLEWFSDESNIDKVLKGFDRLLQAWVGAKAVEAIGNLAALGANLKIIRDGGGILGALLGGGAKAAAGAAAGAAGASAKGAAGVNVSSLGLQFEKIGIGIQSAFDQLLYRGFSLPMLQDWFMNNTLPGQTLRNTGDVGEAVSVTGDAIMDYFTKTLPENFNNFVNRDSYWGKIFEVADRYFESLGKAWSAFLPDWEERHSASNSSILGKAGQLADEWDALWGKKEPEVIVEEPEPEPTPVTAPEIVVEEPEQPALRLTPEQMAAAETFWDEWRKNPGDFSDESWDAFEGAFAGMESVFDELNRRLDETAFEKYPDTWTEMEDIPQEIFGGLEGFSSGAASLDNASATLQGLPAGILAAVRAGVSNIVVTLDGSAVGGLVSPYVSTIIGRQLLTV